MKKAKFWLLVNQHNQVLSKSEDFDSLYQTAIEKVKKNPNNYMGGLWLCCPAWEIKPKFDTFVEVERLRDGRKNEHRGTKYEKVEFTCPQCGLKGEAAYEGYCEYCWKKNGW